VTASMSYGMTLINGAKFTLGLPFVSVD